MVAAARERFATQGFVATTVPQIAKRAGVAVPTVYWALGSKRALVKAIRDAWLAEARTGERSARVLAIDEAGARIDEAAVFMANQWLTGADAVAIQLDAMRRSQQTSKVYLRNAHSDSVRSSSRSRDCFARGSP